MRALVHEIARDPAALWSIEWRDLERVLREVLEKLGFSTHLTRPGKDGGYDLEVSCLESGERKTYLVGGEALDSGSETARKEAIFVVL